MLLSFYKILVINFRECRIYSNISNSDWVSFLGSYIRSLIGAGVSVVGIFMTIKFSEKQSKNDREFMIEMNREERRLSISPLLICQTDNNSTFALEKPI